MIRFQFFPRSVGLTDEMRFVVDAFKGIDGRISSIDGADMKSDDVQKALSPALAKKGFRVETTKRAEDKIKVPVLFGQDNTVDKFFCADALSVDSRIVIEVEAGRATESNQFLKDIFEASMMFGVEYLVLAVRNIYRGHDDFSRVYAFLETMYISGRIKLPLSGILLIGY